MQTSSSSPEAQPREPKKRESNGAGLLGIGLSIVLATAAFFSGLHLGTGWNEADNMEAGLLSALFGLRAAPSADADLSEFWRVWHLVEDKFVSATSTESVSKQDRIYGAIQGMVASFGDPYTVFLPPEDAQHFEEDISGNFGGVGMEVGLRDGLVTVISPLPDTPAERAGIISGDVIVEIDGQSTDNMTVDEAVRLIRGDEGTTVALSLFRQGESDLIEVTIERDNITIPTIDTERIGDVYVIRLYSFNALAESKMQEELQRFRQSGAKKLILDLRGNPGGFLQSAVSIGSYFLPAGKVIVREHFGDAAEEDVYRSSGRVVHTFTPDTMVVLVDQGSASASEILAGALEEHGIATLIGETTFGKGSVQELVQLPGESALKVTIAHWLTPEGVSFSEEGLAPNVTIERTPQQVIDGADPQQEAALQWLRGNRNIGDE